MSKIQKALSALKDSKRNGNAVAETDALDRANKATTKKKSRTSTGMQNQSPSTDRYRGGETTPKHRIDVPIENIVKAGLYPHRGDVEIIGQQFRRIKRPIIQIAFESDLPKGENGNVIMMASALPGAGKSFCAFNLSQSIGLERDVGAVLIDADVLKPGISRSLGLQDHVGLIDYLVDSTIHLEDILVQTNFNNVVVIPAGRQHVEATELLASHRMRDLVSVLSSQYKNRAVIFDMPPLLLTSEAQVLAAQAGQIVMVIEARVSSQESVMRAVGLLDRHKPINAILNKSRSAEGGGYQGDDYGYYSYPVGNESDKENA